MALNISRNHDAIVAAWKDVLDDKTSTNWAVFGYEGQTNTLQVVETGDGSLEEMSDKLSSGKCMYAFCRVKDPKTTLPKNVLIIWQGEGAPDTRKGVCANHVRPIADVLKGAHVTFTARTDDEVETDFIMDKVARASSSKFDFDSSHRSHSPPPAPVSSVYKKTDPSSIMKERDEYLKNMEKAETNERHQSEMARRKSQQDELQQISRNRQTSIDENAQTRNSQSDKTSVAAALESKNYVSMKRQELEAAQKASEKEKVEEKKPRPATVQPPPKPPHQFNKPAGNVGPKPALVAPRVVLAPKKPGNDPLAKAREEEERRRFEQAQRDAENEDRERRLKAETMRQERLKEAQSLISGRRQSEDLSDEPKPRTTSHASSGSAANKSRTTSNASNGAAEDLAVQAYREEERRKFEAIQKESENDEKERRQRSESLRQERLRELAALTQTRDGAAGDTFQSLGQTVKDNRARGKKNEDPELAARREEERRRWEEAQRESQADELERKNKAETLRQQRAEETAALLASRSGAAGAKALFEKSSANAESVPSQATNKPRSSVPSAHQVAKTLFEHSPAAAHEHQQSHSKVPLTPQTSQSSLFQRDQEPTSEPSSFVHPSQRALPPLPAEENEHNDRRVQSQSSREEHSSNQYERQLSGVDADHEAHRNGLAKSQNGHYTQTHVADLDHHEPQRKLSDQPMSPPNPSVNAWKQGLPVRPPSDDEGENDDEAWNDNEPSQVKSPTLSTNSSSSQGQQARALYDYQAADETEISFDPGDIITQIDKVDPGWYQGMAPSGAYGLFPANYVEMIS